MRDSTVELMKRAQRARREKRPNDAHRNLVEAVALCRQIGSQRELAQALRGLGQIDRDLGRGDAALPAYEEAVDITRTLHDPLALASAIRHLGDLHQDAGRGDLAEPLYDEALSIYRDHQETPRLELANAIRPLAILKDATGEAEEARRLWEEARNLYAEVGVQAGVAECEARLAR